MLTSRPLRALLAVTLVAGAVACAEAPSQSVVYTPGPDPHSFARPDQVAVRHLGLDLTVDFDARRLTGTASLTIDNKTGGPAPLLLDTYQLDVRSVRLDDGGEVPFSFGEPVELLGRPLVVEVRPDTEVVHVDYATTPGGDLALGWLEAEQTAAGNHPFLYTQAQPHLARSWIPLPDSPGLRMTYSATVRVPPGLMALMSAENPTAVSPDGVYHFEMPQPIPAYLIALAVGELEFRPTGPRSGIYAEPPLADAAAWELAETPEMIAAAEALYGPYRWGRYDVLFLPPGFPFGGMENPRLTFATPTILAGDRSLVSLVAHELAHSWSGNLVTSATWNDFWLNEGFTTYFEHRIMEAVYGRPYSEMLALLEVQDLQETLAELGDSPDSHLHLDLAGRDPDEGASDVSYTKGYLFLRTLEEAAGRERWDAFLRGYFDRFAFQSMSSQRFVDYLESELLADDPQLAAAVDPEAWVFGPGLPPGASLPTSDAFRQVEAQIAAWQAATPAAELESADWTTHEKLHFLRHLPASLSVEQMAELDRAFGFTGTGNAEILAAWLELAIAHDYPPAQEPLEEFLVKVGRRKFLDPLYEALAATPEGLERARQIYRRARPGYHALTTAALDRLLGWDEDTAAPAGEQASATP